MRGLTTAEAAARWQRGEGNSAVLASSRTYWSILRDNLFTFLNGAFAAIGLVLAWLGSYGDAFLVVVVILGAVIVSVCQEIWAKWKLDAIALLTRPKATVLRDGIFQEIDPNRVVLGDVLLLVPGEQAVVDGPILGDGRAELDEALLTGESEAVPKTAGDWVYSGSFCVSGKALYTAGKVGQDSLAYQLTHSAKAFRQDRTPLQREIELLVRIFLLVAVFLWTAVGIATAASFISFGEGIQRAAVIAGLVPAGLYLAIGLSYALGALRAVKYRVLLQQSNAMESLSNIDVLCLDKTGTLTTNHIGLQAVVPVAPYTIAQAGEWLGDAIANATFRNQTSEAIAHVYPGRQRAVAVEIPFHSSRKWSAIAFADGGWPTTLVLGAPEWLGAERLPWELRDRLHRESQQGLRVLLLAGAATLPLRDPPRLPGDLEPLALVICQDELRPNVAHTLAEFANAGIQIKLISGDSAETVVAVAQQVGTFTDLSVATGPELDALSPPEFQERVVRITLFGRISPEGKAQIVRSLRDRGRYVAMVGDGINDVLAIKQANLGIALESGSKVTRNAADMVLLGDAFPTLPQTFLEGQRIHNGIHDVMKLFLVRVAYFTLLILATGTINGTEAFPFHNKQSALITLLSVGLPTFTFPLLARPGQPPPSTFRALLRFVMPATLMLMLVALGVFLAHLLPLEVRDNRAVVDGTQLAIARSALVTITVVCGLLLVPFLKPPSRFWVAVEPLSPDRRYTWVTLALLAVYGGVLVVPAARNFFDLVLLPWPEYPLLGAIAGLWSLLLRYLWRRRTLERFLGIEF